MLVLHSWHLHLHLLHHLQNYLPSLIFLVLVFQFGLHFLYQMFDFEFRKFVSPFQCSKYLIGRIRWKQHRSNNFMSLSFQYCSIAVALHNFLSMVHLHATGLCLILPIEQKPDAVSLPVNIYKFFLMNWYLKSITNWHIKSIANEESSAFINDVCVGIPCWNFVEPNFSRVSI